MKKQNNAMEQEERLDTTRKTCGTTKIAQNHTYTQKETDINGHNRTEIIRNCQKQTETDRN